MSSEQGEQRAEQPWGCSNAPVRAERAEVEDTTGFVMMDEFGRTCTDPRTFGPSGVGFPAVGGVAVLGIAMHGGIGAGAPAQAPPR